MATSSTWRTLLLTCLCVEIFRTYGGEFSFCFVKHFGKGPEQKVILIGLETQTRITVTRMSDSSTTVVPLFRNQWHVVDLTSTDTNLRANIIENKGIMVNASGKVHVLGYDRIIASTDIFIPREHSHLGKYYAALTHSQDGKTSLVAIVAVQQDFETAVSIILPDTFSGFVDYEGRQYTGGDVLCLKLTYQQTFQLIASSDLSGTVILSDANLAVFTGAGRTSVSASNTTDHLVDAVPPVNFWGTDFFVVKIDPIRTDLVKIIASEDNTTITLTYCDQQSTFSIETAFIDIEAYDIECDIIYIAADKNILVGHFLQRINENPALYFPLPKKHFAASYVIASPPISIYMECKLILIASSSAELTYNSIPVFTPWTSIQSTDLQITSFIVAICCIGNTVKDANGLPFWGYLQCVGQDTTAATALMPSTYDMRKVPSSIVFRPEDIAATDVCKSTETTLSDFTSTEVTTSTVETPIGYTSASVAEGIAIAGQSTTELITTYDTTTVLPGDSADNMTATTAIALTNTSILNNGGNSSCPCSLCRKPKITNMTLADLQHFLRVIRAEMVIKKNETSAWKRKLTSAKDSRPSSKGIGLLGSLLLSFVLGIIVLIDVSNYCCIFRRRKITMGPS